VLGVGVGDQKVQPARELLFELGLKTIVELSPDRCCDKLFFFFCNPGEKVGDGHSLRALETGAGFVGRIWLKWLGHVGLKMPCRRWGGGGGDEHTKPARTGCRVSGSDTLPLALRVSGFGQRTERPQSRPEEFTTDGEKLIAGAAGPQA